MVLTSLKSFMRIIISLIFITALSNSYTLEIAKQLRPIDYIVKPLREMDLITTVSIGMANYKALNSNNRSVKADINTIAISPLSSKEKDFLLEICKGQNNVQIVKNLELSHNTIKWQIQNIHSKLGVKNRIASAQFMLSI
ncbi:MAG: DNA-binding NarL/FixJ family response regulator [Saprospiraceae bacterium]|jgi:DNA-binding NarL/FixJ family response regulator